MTRTPVLIQRLPEKVTARHVRHLIHDLQNFVNGERPHVVFDLSQVKQMDASGVEMLLDVLQAVNKRDGDLKLAAPSSAARTFLELTRLDSLFEIHESSADAAASFGAAIPEAAVEPSYLVRQRVNPLASPELARRAS